MKENAIQEKSYDLAISVVRAYKIILNSTKEYNLTRQFLRSGTAVAALVRESTYAQSRADFINKLSIGLKECNETVYWIELLHETEYLDKDKYLVLRKKALENIKLLTSIIKSSKMN